MSHQMFAPIIAGIKMELEGFDGIIKTLKEEFDYYTSELDTTDNKDRVKYFRDFTKINMRVNLVRKLVFTLASNMKSTPDQFKQIVPKYTQVFTELIDYLNVGAEKGYFSQDEYNEMIAICIRDREHTGNICIFGHQVSLKNMPVFILNHLFEYYK